MYKINRRNILAGFASLPIVGLLKVKAEEKRPVIYHHFEAFDDYSLEHKIIPPEYDGINFPGQLVLSASYNYFNLSTGLKDWTITYTWNMFWAKDQRNKVNQLVHQIWDDKKAVVEDLVIRADMDIPWGDDIKFKYWECVQRFENLYDIPTLKIDWNTNLLKLESVTYGGGNVYSN